MRETMAPGCEAVLYVPGAGRCRATLAVSSVTIVRTTQPGPPPRHVGPGAVVWIAFTRLEATLRGRLLAGRPLTHREQATARRAHHRLAASQDQHV
jgi:hypothetical protein